MERSVEPDEVNPYASPIGSSVPVEDQWHFLDHHQLYFLLGLLGLGFGVLCLAGSLVGVLPLLLGAAMMFMWVALNLDDRAAARTAMERQAPDDLAEAKNRQPPAAGSPCPADQPHLLDGSDAP
ncbi:MAG: hypothetical protein ACYC35_10775 [Pirellulales bacterium]